MIPPLKMDGGGGLDGSGKSPYLVPKISAKTKSPHLHKGVTKMFWNPFRRIKELEFEVGLRDDTIKDLKNAIERLESPTRPKYHPNATCIDCKYLVVKERAPFGDIYYCRLNNNCEDYALKY
nr:MAG TPA: hypothetical protein [Bacteriophage sp.]